MKIAVKTKSGVNYEFDDVMNMRVAEFKGSEVVEVTHGEFHVVLDKDEHAVAHRIRRHSLDLQKEVLRQYVLLTTFRVIFCNSDGSHYEEQDFVDGDAFRRPIDLMVNETFFWIMFPRVGQFLKNVPHPKLQSPDKVMEFVMHNYIFVQGFIKQVMKDQGILNADGSYDYREFVL